ncbi:MAG: hypothetical protein WCG05_00915 [Alphaproteobacteria bacterium]
MKINKISRLLGYTALAFMLNGMLATEGFCAAAEEEGSSRSSFPASSVSSLEEDAVEEIAIDPKLKKQIQKLFHKIKEKEVIISLQAQTIRETYDEGDSMKSKIQTFESELLKKTRSIDRLLKPNDLGKEWDLLLEEMMGLSISDKVALDQLLMDQLPELIQRSEVWGFLDATTTQNLKSYLGAYTASRDGDQRNISQGASAD